LARKKGGKSSGYISSGERRNVAKSTTKLMRREYLENNQVQRAINQYQAYLKGKKVMLTVANPNKNETGKPFIRVNARDVWGPIGKKFQMKSS